jgi:nucleoside-diphosphate-sugar epimerase
MRVLVTGGNGYIGSHVASRLAARGHEVCATCRSNRDRLSTLSSGVEVEYLDVTEASAVDALARSIRPDAIIHTAALVTSQESASSMPALEFPISSRHRIFNIACRDIFTLLQVAERAVETAGSKSEISISMNAPARKSIMNIDRATTELGFVASTLETNLLNYIVELRRRS